MVLFFIVLLAFLPSYFAESNMIKNLTYKVKKGSQVLEAEIIFEVSIEEYMQTLITQIFQESDYLTGNFNLSEVPECDYIPMNTSGLISIQISKFNHTNCKSFVSNHYFLSIFHEDLSVAFQYIQQILDLNFYSVNGVQIVFHSKQPRKLQCGDECDQCHSETTCQLCSLGYYLNSNLSCTACSSQCRKCSSESNCLHCYSGYYLNSNSQCELCSFPCLFCASKNICIDCSSGYFLNSSLQCESCPLFCEECTSKIECSWCYFGYYLNSSLQCASCSSNCGECSSKTNCLSCYYGYYLNSSSQCASCSSFCEFCSSETECLWCKGEYYLNSNLQCVSCSSQCFQCSSETKCSSCYYGYYLNSSSLCASCSFGCEVCSSETSCIWCNESYYLTANLQCASCSYGCKECSTWTNCSLCYDGFYLTSNFQCALCTFECIKCHSRTNCYLCYEGEGLYLTSNSQCTLCSFGCEICASETICSLCREGYYLTSNSKCAECADPCNICHSRNNCSLCYEGYYLTSDSQCVYCSAYCEECYSGTNCSKCEDGYYLTSTFECASCSFGCKECFSATNCSLCYEGNYFTSDFKCVPCSDACNECDSQNNCSLCYDGYYLTSDLQCLSCSDECEKCLSQTNCSFCYSGYYLNSASICELCPPYCDECSSENYCSYCAQGYYVNSSFQCAKCSSFCYVCSSEINCLLCIDGYYVNSSLQCELCSFACAECSSPSYCSSCFSDYYLTPDHQCSEYCLSGNYANEYNECIPCVFPCITCNSKTSCSSCHEGYYLTQGNQCSLCPVFCSTCVSQSNCTGCLTGYLLQTNFTCMPKLCDSSCQNCSLGICLECFFGYVFNSNQTCVQNTCDTNCSNCTYGNCKKCQNGYWLSEGKCQLCNQHCLSCQNLMSCICAPNYVLINSTCVNCEIPNITDSYFTSDFSGLIIQFSSYFTSQINSGCGFISTTDSFGEAFRCYLLGNTVKLIFGNSAYFSNTSVFSVYMPYLYSNLCLNSTQLTLNKSARYLSEPLPVYFKINGVKTQSLSCNSNDLTFSAYQISGIYNNFAYFNWSASVIPKNPQITSLVSFQKTSYLNISLALFNKSNSEITVTLLLSNSLKMNFSSSFTTQLTENASLTIELDVSSSISIFSSQDYTINARVIDFCDSTCRPSYYWKFGNSDNQKFYILAFPISDSSALALKKSSLVPGYFYSFEVIANCSDIVGSQNISIYADYSPLILIFDRTDSTIPKKFDLFIDGSNSYDPDHIGNLSFHWNCIQSNGQKCVYQSNILPNFTILSSNLISGALTVTLVISADNRRATKSLNFIIQEDLSTYLSILFPFTKVEPSLTTVINAKLFTSSNVSLYWTQEKGSFLNVVGENLPSLTIGPNLMQRGMNYKLTIHAREATNSASASVSFLTNLSPICEVNLSVSPSTGSSLTTLFKFFIDVCIDPDLDLPLTYTFGILNENETYLISQASQFNSIETKLFEGDFETFVNLCDQLLGCTLYNSSITVTTYTSRALYMETESLLTQYQSHTVNKILVPIISVSYLNTFSMSNSDFYNIFQDTINYIHSLPTINSESLSILLSFVSSVFKYNQQNLNYTTISGYLQQILNLFERSKSEITIKNIQSLFNINQKILQFGNDTIDFIDLVNSKLNQIFKIYSLNKTPGSIIANLSNANMFYYKSRYIANNLSNSSVLFSDGTIISIDSLPFTSNLIINSIFSVYHQPNGYASIIGIEFTSSGNYSNYTISLNNEYRIGINSSIFVFLPIQNNITGDWVCSSYDGIDWIENGCKVISSDSKGVLLSIVSNSLFQLTPSTPAVKYYPAVIISGICLLILVMFAPTLLVKSNKKEPQVIKEESLSYFSNFILLGIGKKSSNIQIFERIVHYCAIINFCLMVEGAFYSSSSISLSKQSKLFIIGLISAVATIPFIFLAIFSIFFQKYGRNLILFFEIFTFCVSISLIAYFSTVCDSNTQIDWIVSFGWALLFLIFFEIVTVSILYLTLKLKKRDQSKDYNFVKEIETERVKIDMNNESKLKINNENDISDEILESNIKNNESIMDNDDQLSDSANKNDMNLEKDDSRNERWIEVDSSEPKIIENSNVQSVEDTIKSSVSDY